MQDLNLAFIVKLGAIPQPILATIALMAELHNAELTKPGEQVAGDCVDIEHIVKEHPHYTARRTTKE
jgi:catechol 2,3-dioxygenase-like lactoylglutathione lyase family enzyme